MIVAQLKPGDFSETERVPGRDLMSAKVLEEGVERAVWRRALPTASYLL